MVLVVSGGNNTPICFLQEGKKPLLYGVTSFFPKGFQVDPTFFDKKRIIHYHENGQFNPLYNKALAIYLKHRCSDLDPKFIRGKEQIKEQFPDVYSHVSQSNKEAYSEEKVIEPTGGSVNLYEFSAEIKKWRY